jgi:hypothetical protein
MILKMGVILSNEVVSELNSRNYYLQTTATPPATTPPATKPVISRSTYIDYAVQLALQYYSMPSIASSATYLSSTQWNNIINTSVTISQQLDNQYTINGLSGLSMSGCCPSVGRLGNMGGPTWTSTWGPVIMQMIGSALTIGGTYWQQQVTRAALEQQYQTTTGQQLGVPNQQDVSTMAKILSGPPYNMSQADISALLSSAVPNTAPKSELPSWLLPVGIAVGAMALLGQRERRS